jgi:hypothetical protein
MRIFSAPDGTLARQNSIAIRKLRPTRSAKLFLPLTLIYVKTSDPPRCAGDQPS